MQQGRKSLRALFISQNSGHGLKMEKILDFSLPDKEFVALLDQVIQVLNTSQNGDEVINCDAAYSWSPEGSEDGLPYLPLPLV